jgi:hypothetical protein
VYALVQANTHGFLKAPLRVNIQSGLESAFMQELTARRGRKMTGQRAKRSITELHDSHVTMPHLSNKKHNSPIFRLNFRLNYFALLPIGAESKTADEIETEET